MLSACIVAIFACGCIFPIVTSAEDVELCTHGSTSCPPVSAGGLFGAIFPFIFIIYCLMCVPSVMYCLREWNIDLSEVARRIVRGSDSEYNRAAGRAPNLMLHPNNLELHISPMRQASNGSTGTQEQDAGLDPASRVPSRSTGASLRSVGSSRPAAPRTTSAMNPLSRVPFDPLPSSTTATPLGTVSQRTMMDTYRSTQKQRPPPPASLSSPLRSPSARPHPSTGRTPLQSGRV